MTETKKQDGSDSLDELISYDVAYDTELEVGTCPKCEKREFRTKVDASCYMWIQCGACDFKAEMVQIIG